MDEYERCYECKGLGDDYRFENGEWICNCDDCPVNRWSFEDMEGEN